LFARLTGLSANQIVGENAHKIVLNKVQGQASTTQLAVSAIGLLLSALRINKPKIFNEISIYGYETRHYTNGRENSYKQHKTFNSQVVSSIKVTKVHTFLATVEQR
jgi:hypothetical protein